MNLLSGFCSGNDSRSGSRTSRNGYWVIGDVSVVGVLDEKWGEQVVAFIRAVSDAEISGEELHDYLRGQLAPHKTPAEWVFLNELPMTASGKIQKFVLRDEFLARQATEE